MGYQLNELRPAKILLNIDGRDFTISLVTLSLEIEFQKKYGSLGGIFPALKEKPNDIFYIVWLLLEEKEYFDNNLAKFTKALEKSKNLTGEKLAVCINSSISLSVPLIKNMKRHQEILEMNNTEDYGGPCYASYYDSLAKRYGYTLDQFYSLTLRQLHLILKTIGDKSYEELEIQASLAGRTLKPRITYTDITEEEEQENIEHATDALKRLQENYKDGQRK